MSRLPESWVLRRFEQVASIGNGQVSPTEEPYIDYIHIGPENVDSDTGRISDVKTARELGLISGKYLFDSDAIVYSKIRPNLNKVCIPDFEGICSADMYAIWANEGIDRLFLYQYMRSSEFLRQSVPVSGRTGLPKINREDLNKLRVPVPPPAEQRAIAAILSTWDAAITLTERLIAALQARKRGLMQRLLTGEVRFPGFEGEEWVEVRLGDVGEVSNGGTPDTNTPEYWNGQYAWVTPSEITSLPTRFISSTQRQISEAGLSNSSAVLLEPYSLLVCTRATVGNCAINRVPMTTNQGFKNLTPNTEHDVEFFYYLLEFNTNQLIRYASGSTFIELSKKDFIKLRFDVPGKTEQIRIAEVLAVCDDEIFAYTESIERLKTQKKGLMQRLLTGEIRVQVDE